MKGQEQVCLKSEEVSSQKKYYRYCCRELHDIELWTGNNNAAHDKLQKIKQRILSGYNFRKILCNEANLQFI